MTLSSFFAARVQGVFGTFDGAVDTFNKNDWDQYKYFLDPDAVAFNITAPGYVRGRENIANYFRSISDQVPTDLQFEPTNRITWFPGFFPLSVRGVARWTHRANHHVRVRIKYEFQFSPGELFLADLNLVRAHNRRLEAQAILRTYY